MRTNDYVASSFMIAFVFVACSQVCWGQAETNIVSPSEVGNEEGNFGFGGGPAFRGQYLYPAEDFMSLPESYRTITAMTFRSDKDNMFFAPTTGPARYILSTTEADALVPGSNFEANLGDDATQVFEGPLTFQTDDMGPGPRNFDFVVPFDPPFTYDPSRGNLLVDFLAPENWDSIRELQIDAHIDFTGGPITLIGNLDPTADTAALDLAAPALWSTQFTFISLPPGLIDNPGLDNPGLDGRLPPGQRDGLPWQSRHARLVPEPASVTLFLLGCCIGFLARRYSLRS